MQLKQIARDMISKQHLIRKKDLSYRKSHYEQTRDKIRQKCPLNYDQFIILILQRQIDGKWVNHTYIVQKKAPLNFFYTQYVRKQTQSQFFYTIKNRTQLNTGMIFNQIYQKYANSDDHILYLELRSMEIFG